MTVTSRFLKEKPLLASRRVPSPFPSPPPNRVPIGRLGFLGPSPKLDWSPADLAHMIGVSAMKDAVVFPDTSIFTTEMLDTSVWDALYTKRILITPGVWKELLPWLKTPFRNKAVRDRVFAAVQQQVNSGPGRGPSIAQTFPSGDVPKIEVQFVDEEFAKHGYEYYYKLLALRKIIGPVVASVLTKKLGRAPTNDEFLAEVQSHLGPRGFLLAKKGLEAANSPNKLTDELLVVMAVLTAIVRGTEVIILTRDTDVLEQYFKLLCLMKEHYRAMLVAERYAANPELMPFREVPIAGDDVLNTKFSGSSVLEFETTDADFNPLPAKFHFVNVYCVLLGGGPSEMKVTISSFCAETEMAQMLRMKAITGGLNTDKLGGRNCTIYTAPLTGDNHRVVITIGNERTHSLGDFGSFGHDDHYNTLFANELTTHYAYEDR